MMFKNAQHIVFIVVLMIVVCQAVAPFDKPDNETNVSPRPRYDLDGNDELFREGDIGIPTGGKIGEAASTGKEWPDGRIPYVIDCSIKNLPNAIKALNEAIDVWQGATDNCITFVPKEPDDDVFVTFLRSSGCWASYVGYHKKNVTVSIGYGCEFKHVMVHELGHVIGFWHEQSRPDRDQHVILRKSNIIRGLEHNFNKVTGKTDSHGEAYDFNSIMHYPFNAFSTDPNRNTLEPFDGIQGKTPYVKISKSDIYQAQQMYNCSLRKSSGTKDRAKRQAVNDFIPDCVDHHRHCESWAKHGHCSSNPVPLLTFCKKSCGNCGSCADQASYCPGSYTYNVCVLKAPPAMKECKMSCEACGPDLESLPPTKPATKPTIVPVVELETTQKPTTLEPTTLEPTTLEPTTLEPTTLEPITLEPTTKEPTTKEPTTKEPTTKEPTTLEPTTLEPTTKEPTTKEPTTLKPTTKEPTTLEPTTLEPTTKEPTTKEPTTKEPTTKEPTTKEPTTQTPTEPSTPLPTPPTPGRILGAKIAPPSKKYIGILCIDRSPLCQSYAESGRCETDNWVKLNCPKVCKLTDDCDLEAYTPLGTCATPLGVGLSHIEDKKIIPNNNFRSSSSYITGNWYAVAHSGRLYQQDDSDRKFIGAWCGDPRRDRDSPWLEIDLDEVKTITGVATQGRDKYFEHVKTYEVAYKQNKDDAWQPYNENGEPKVFNGNCDHLTPSLTTFDEPIKARFIQLLPKTTSGNACMRVELYGCDA